MTRRTISGFQQALRTTSAANANSVILFRPKNAGLGSATETMAGKWITVLGSYVADLAFRVDALPVWGETRMGGSFALGPGGKGSNQAVAAARAGGRVSFISKVGDDPFGEMSRRMYREEGIDTEFLYTTYEATGAAAILIDSAKGENAIVVVPGACFGLTTQEVDAAEDRIAASSVFVAQLELPIAVVEQG